MAGAQDIPRCTLFLFVAAMTCHIMVLVGNLATAKMLNDLGASAGGWSSIGSSVTHAMDTELNPAMDKVIQGLTTAIDAVTQVENGMDTMLSVTGSTTDKAMQHYDPKTTDESQFKEHVLSGVEMVASKSMAKVQEIVNMLMKVLEPVLAQIGEWLESFSEKIQDVLEEFGTTVDRAQKIFDQVMAQISDEAGGMEEEMLRDTYSLFDSDNSGEIHINDLHEAADLYGITALQGQKAVELFNKYDHDGVGGIDLEEYAEFVSDPSLPGIMTTVLREYSKKLATIGGRLAMAGMRAELADAVVDYLGLVAGKNLTKVEWATSRLVSGEIPIEFVADLLYQLVQNEKDPAQLNVLDVPQIIINYTMGYNASFVIQAMDLLATPEFYVNEGFDLTQEDECLVEVVTWVGLAPGGMDALKKYAEVQPSGSESYADAYDKKVQAREAKYAATHKDAAASSASFQSSASRQLRDVLLGGVSAAAKGEDPDATEVTGKGQPAKPETKAFAKELADNVTESVMQNTEQCFVYSGTSSNAIDSIANGVNGMIKKTQTFLKLMSKYAGPDGVKMLEDEAASFANKTVQDVMHVSEVIVDSGVDSAKCSLGDSKACAAVKSTLQDVPMELTGGVTFLTDTLSELKSALPTVIDNLQFAKKEVSSISSAINSIMQVLGLKAPPLFARISSLYKVIWVAYFVVFFLFTFSFLFYAFWANGFFGGPQVETASDSSYEPPQSFLQRIRTCCGSCLACISGCTSYHLCFWSLLLLAQVLVLVLFIISLVICLLTGVQAFLGAGCSTIFLIGDNSVCTAALNVVKTFLKTFGFEGVSMGDVCHEKQLLTCALIRDEVTQSAVFVMIGAILASVFSFEMLLDSATKHERVRCKRLMDTEFPGWQEKEAAKND